MLFTKLSDAKKYITKQPFLFLAVLLLIPVFFSCPACAGSDSNYPIFTQTDANLAFYTPPADNQPYPLVKTQRVKNVILLIGDGMGLNQVAAARIKGAGLDGKLFLEKMPVTGIARTHSANNAVTDSAAAATALACGIKTNNRMIGLAPDGAQYVNIIEAVQKTGMKTALVVTSNITDATPAAFASHIKSRYSEPNIAQQLVDSRINILFGGGKNYFIPKGQPGSLRKDNLDLIQKAQNNGYQIIETKEQLQSANGQFLLGLFEPNSLTTIYPEPSIAELTQKAIQILNSPIKEPPPHDFFDTEKGFFLMVEGSQIDTACHKNDVNRCIRQTLLFDLAVKVAIDFAALDGKTLVIVTADHETRGLTIAESKPKSKIINFRWAIDANTPYFGPTDGHTGQPVHVFAFGPDAELFTGTLDNTDIPKKIAKLLSIKDFPVQMKKNN